MKLRTLVLSLLGISAFCLVIGQNTETAEASLQSCNPTIASISGTSNVWGVAKNMSARGPGSEIAGGTSNQPPGINQIYFPNDPAVPQGVIAPANPLIVGTSTQYSSIETVQSGGLDATSGMVYRGNGLWSDNSGNRLQLSIQATRTNVNTAGNVSGVGSPCAGTLQGPNSSFGLPGAIGSNTTQIALLEQWCIVSQGGCGQTWGLQAVVGISLVPQPTAPPPVTPPPSSGSNPILSVSAECQGTSPIFRLSWSAVASNYYNVWANNQKIGDHISAAQLSFIAPASPGSSPSFFVDSEQNTGTHRSNTVTQAAQNCTPTPTPTPTPTRASTAPGAFTVSAQAVCISTTTIQVTLSWTASSGAQVYSLIRGSNSHNELGGLANTDSSTLSYQYNEPSGLSTSQIFAIDALRSTPDGTSSLFISATPGAGTTQVANNFANGGGRTIFSVAMPDCSPQQPGAFSGTIQTSCSGANPIATLNWNGASGANSYKVYDKTSSTQGTALLATLPVNATTYIVQSLRTPTQGGLQFSVEATNDGGISTAQIPALATDQPPVPDCAPQASITLAAINSVCSAGNPSNILTWSSSDGSAGALGDFTIFRDGTQIGTTTNTSYTDSTPTSGTTYSYTVQSGSTTSNARTVTTTTCPQPPGLLTLTITAACTGTTPTNQLTWTASSNALRYEIQRDGQPITSVDAPLMAYSDNLITTGTTYQYTVRAINAVGTRDAASQSVVAANCEPAAPVTHPPVANDDSGTTPHNTPITLQVLSNDTDSDGNLDPASIRITQDPTHGSVALTANHDATYTPTTGFTGTDTFVYEICDTTNLCDTATATITVLEPNTPPPTPVLPGPLTLSVQPLCVGQTPQNVLTWTASDNTDTYTVRRDAQTLTTVTPTTTSYVDATAVDSTSYVYAINATNNAGTTASNQITTKTASCAPAVNNQPPQANDDTAATDQNSFVVIDVLANDTDSDGQIVPSCTRVISQPIHGITVVDTTNGKIAYTPAKDFSGTDTFVYQICDDKGATDTATVTVTVRPPVPPKTDTNSPPQANDDNATTAHNKPVDIDILLNDSDPDGNLDPTCVKVTKQPGHGTVHVNATNGRATYTPQADFSGTDTFQYTVCDTAKAVSNTATVSIAVGQAPPATLATTGIPVLGFLIDLWNRFLTFLHLR